MTTAPVQSISDELIAELEFDLEMAETTHALEASVSRDSLAALLAERAELKRDAARYRWLRRNHVGASFDWDDNGMCVLAFEIPDHLAISRDTDSTIDAAMQEQQP